MTYCKQKPCFLEQKRICCHECEFRESCKGACKECAASCGKALADRTRKVAR